MTHKIAPAIAVSVLLVLGSVVVPAAVAHADAIVVTTAAELQSAISSSAGVGTVVKLGQSFDVSSSPPATELVLDIDRSVTLDLDGFALSTQRIVLSTGVTFAIDDSSASGSGALNAVTSSDNPVIATTKATLIVNGGAVSAVAKESGGVIAAVAADQDGDSAGGSAAVGGAADQDGGTVMVNGGSLTATTPFKGAAIGGGENGDGGSISVTGGSVNGHSQQGGALLGGGLNGDGGTISVSGGTVNAFMYDTRASGIGGGAGGGGGTITISGGTVVSNSNFGAGIGGGEGGAGGTITISGGDVRTESTEGAGIGGGSGSDGGAIRISGGTVSGTSYFGAGIGGGWMADGGNVAISGGEVAVRSTTGAGIGGGDGGSGGTVVISAGHVTTSAMTTVGAGIGGGQRGSGGTITISGGTVDVKSSSGAGIGGGMDGSGGTVLVSGGDVTASSDGVGAGVGGGMNGDGGKITISGGSLKAVGSGVGSSLGGGFEGSGGTINVGAAAVCYVSGNGPLIGAGTLGASFGDVEIDGSLIVDPSAYVLAVPTGATVTVGSSGTIQSTRIYGGPVVFDTGGTIINHGTLITTKLGGVAVTDHNYLVSFDPDGGTETDSLRVYAATATNATLSLPTSTRSDRVFGGWLSPADEPFTADTELTGDVTVRAAWTVERLQLSTTASSIVAGQSLDFTAEGFVLGRHGHAHEGGPVDDVSIGDFTAETSLVSSDLTDVVAGHSITFTRAGTHTITAHVTDVPSTTASVDVIVTPDFTKPETLRLAPSSPSVLHGDSLTFVTSGDDVYGNDLGDLSSQAVLSTDNATDAVAGATITFPTVGSHVVTAAYRGVTTTAAVTVLADPPVPAVVTPPTPPAAAAPAPLPARTFAVKAPSGLQVPGQKIRVTASRLAPDEKYVLKIAGTKVASGHANASGEVSRTVTIPASMSGGEHAVKVVGARSVRSGRDHITTVKLSKTLTVTTKPSPQAESNRIVKITVRGLAVGEPVTVTYDGHRVSGKHAKANGRGRYVLKTSAGWAWGYKSVVATGIVDTRRGVAKVDVEARR